jgi:hypothetical protein
MTSLSVEDEEKVNHRTTDEAVTDLIVGSWGQGNMGTLVQPWLYKNEALNVNFIFYHH